MLLSDAYTRFGDAANARKAAEDGLAVARDARFAWGIAAAQRARGRLAAAGGEVIEARASFDEAVEGFRAIPAPFEVAVTCLDLAMLARDGDPGAAASWIAEARAAFAALGLEDHVRRADEVRSRGGPPVP